eukprot:811183-Rhodomonas_salina.1
MQVLQVNWSESPHDCPNIHTGKKAAPQHSVTSVKESGTVSGAAAVQLPGSPWLWQAHWHSESPAQPPCN